MKLTTSQINYGLGKCRSCQSLIPLNAFRQWGEAPSLNRAVSCLVCEGGDKNYVFASEADRKRGGAWRSNSAFICAAKSKPCADCGKRFPSVCMDFDHRPEHTKEFNLAGMKNSTREAIEAEIAKCDVVCACCHRIRTAKRKYAGTGRPKAPQTR